MTRRVSLTKQKKQKPRVYIYIGTRNRSSERGDSSFYRSRETIYIFAFCVREITGMCRKHTYYVTFQKRAVVRNAIVELSTTVCHVRNIIPRGAGSRVRTVVFVLQWIYARFVFEITVTYKTTRVIVIIIIMQRNSLGSFTSFT